MISRQLRGRLNRLSTATTAVERGPLGDVTRPRPFLGPVFAGFLPLTVFTTGAGATGATTAAGAALAAFAGLTAFAGFAGFAALAAGAAFAGLATGATATFRATGLAAGAGFLAGVDLALVGINRH